MIVFKVRQLLVLKSYPTVVNSGTSIFVMPVALATMKYCPTDVKSGMETIGIPARNGLPFP